MILRHKEEKPRKKNIPFASSMMKKWKKNVKFDWIKTMGSQQNGRRREDKTKERERGEQERLVHVIKYIYTPGGKKVREEEKKSKL